MDIKGPVGLGRDGRSWTSEEGQGDLFIYKIAPLGINRDTQEFPLGAGVGGHDTALIPERVIF